MRLSHRKRAERRLAMANDARAGMANDEIAEKYDVTVVTVLSAMREHKVPKRSASQFGGNRPDSMRPPRASTFAVLKLLLDGMPAMEIAAKLECAKQWIYRIAGEARKAGFDVPYQPGYQDRKKKTA